MPKSFKLSNHQYQALSHLGIDAWYLSPLSRDSIDMAYQTEQAEISRLVQEMQEDLMVSDEQAAQSQSVGFEAVAASTTQNKNNKDIKDDKNHKNQSEHARMTVEKINVSPQPAEVSEINNVNSQIAEKTYSRKGLAVSQPVRLNGDLNLSPPEAHLIIFPALTENIEADKTAILQALQQRKEATKLPVITAMLDRVDEQNQDTWLIITPPPTTEQVSSNQRLGEQEEQLLTAWLKSIGKPPEDIYVTPIIKQAIHRQLDPTQAMLSDFLPILAAEIALIKPSRILVMGRVANHALLQTKAPLSRLMSVPYQLQLDKNYSPIPLTAMPCMRYFLAMPSEKGWLWKMTKNLVEQS